ncbi:glycosyl transferase [Pseudoscourfieldia marina]
MDAKARASFLNVLVGFILGAVFVSLFQGKTPEAPKTGLDAYPIVSAFEDSLFLGPQEGFEPATRRAGYVYKSNQYQDVYDKTWTQGGYPRQSCWGCRFAGDIVNKVQFHSMLDAGTGNGALVRLMREHGKAAWGIELSKAVLEKECPDMLQKGWVEPGILTNLPYEDNSFDLVYSADVLEHIHPEEADKVIGELVRVSRRHVVMSISLKGHTKATAENNEEANRHTMLRPRQWWEQKFREHGAVVNRELFWSQQERDLRYTRDQMRECRWEGNQQEGGLYEVCVVDNKWLVGRREQENLRRDRCITTQNMELEPWFFTFRKLR